MWCSCSRNIFTCLSTGQGLRYNAGLSVQSGFLAVPASPTERHLAAIVAADVVGYSRLMGADEKGTLAALKAHRRELIDPLIAAHKGHIVKTTGDGLLLSFPSVVEAVSCAVAVQSGMAKRNRGHRLPSAASNSASASISATSLSRRATYSAMASTSRPGSSRSRRRAASACPRMRTGRSGASSKFPSSTPANRT